MSIAEDWIRGTDIPLIELRAHIAAVAACAAAGADLDSSLYRTVYTATFNTIGDQP